ncbi:MAG: sugar-binding domain-containing protein, partial [Ignavibacteriaceae bacterium]
MREILLFSIFVTIIVFSLNFQFLYSQIATLEATLKIENVDGITVPYQGGIPLPSFEKQNHKIINLAGSWKKQRAAADDNITLAKRDSIGYANLISESAGRSLSNYDDAAWEEKTLPAVENEMHTFPTVPELFNDGVWYRKNFEVDASDSGKFAKIIFLAVNYVADVWINGEYIGYHEGGYTPFAFDISSRLKSGETNIIAVRVDLVSWNKRNDVIPYKAPDWFNYGGIIHDVYIEFSNRISVVRNDIIPLDLEGNIQTTTVLRN